MPTQVLQSSAMLPARQLPAILGSAQQQQPAMSLEAVEELVRAQAAEVLGEDIGLDGYFAAGHVDSLSAVELANTISRAAAVPLPGLKPPVPHLHKYGSSIHRANIRRCKKLSSTSPLGTQEAAKQTAPQSVSSPICFCASLPKLLCAGTLVFDYPSVRAAAKYVHGLLAAKSSHTQLPAAPSPAAAPAQDDQLLISVEVAAQLPCADPAVTAADAVSCVPHGRWDLEAHRAGKVISPYTNPAFLQCTLTICPQFMLSGIMS